MIIHGFDNFMCCLFSRDLSSMRWDLKSIEGQGFANYSMAR